jgi:hypothetical protein
MFRLNGKKTKMVMCFLAFLFFGFILFSLLGKNMEGMAKNNPGRLTHCYSDGLFGSGYAWDNNGDVLACNDKNKNPNPPQINSCNGVTKYNYVCKNPGYQDSGHHGTGFSTDSKDLAYYQWLQK